ncbi:MAG: FIST N-terminal domain-containing protein [Rhodothermales bacterium]
MAHNSLVLARPHIPKAETSIQHAKDAVLDFAGQLEGPALACVIFFCSSTYDLDELSRNMKAAFSCPVFGCTTAGEIGLRYQKKSIIGVGLPASLFNVRAVQNTLLQDFDNALDQLSVKLDEAQHLGIALFDGLASQKDQVINLQNRLYDLNVVGAAAGDIYGDKPGFIYADGQFKSDAVSLLVLEPRISFKPFSFTEESEQDLLKSSRHRIETLRKTMPDILFTIGFEHYKRRLNIESKQLNRDVERMLSPLNFTGFSTLTGLRGDAFNGVVFGVG